MFQMMGVFVKLERVVTCERAISGLARAKAKSANQNMRSAGLDLHKIAGELSIGISIVQRVMKMSQSCITVPRY
jgi:hypothetical protein